MLALAALGLAAATPGCRHEPVRGTSDSVVAAPDPAALRHGLTRLDSIGPRAATDPESLAELSRALRHPIPEVAARAAYWLGTAGAAAVPVLVAALSDPSPRLRASACYGLGLIGRPAGAAIPALARVLAGDDDTVANMADWALSQIEPAGPPTITRLLRTLRYGDEQERIAAASRLGTQVEAPPEVIPLLVRALGDSASMVAESAVEALVRIGSPAIPALQAARQGGNPARRAWALLALGRIRPYSHF